LLGAAVKACRDLATLVLGIQCNKLDKLCVYLVIASMQFLQFTFKTLLENVRTENYSKLEKYP
jgi:hypothetical protein